MGMGRIAASGMDAAMQAMDVISNNIANQGTVGFKQSSIKFSDLYPSGGSGNQPGMGVDVAGISQNFSPAGSSSSGTATNMAIKGSGFFMVKDPTSGQVVYTRDGSFTFNQSLSNYLMFGSQHVQGFQAVNGSIPSGATASDLLINTSPVPAVATTAVTQTGLNLSPVDDVPTNPTFNPSDSHSYNTTSSVKIYDSLGSPTDVNMYYVKSASPANTWTMYAVVNGTVINQATPTTMTFNANTGALTTPSSPVTLSFTPTTGAAGPQAFTVDFTGATQTGSQNVIGQFTPNGSLPGAFSKVTVDEKSGLVSALYTNGTSVLQGQVALANFSNPEALTYLGASQWSATLNAGTPMISPNNSTDNIASGALEDSNVNVTQQLVNLIGAQNAFQANAQAEQTYNQVMQVVTKL